MKVNLTTTIRQSVETMVDLSTDRITALRPGFYVISGMVSYERNSSSLAGFEAYAQFGLNSTNPTTSPPALSVVPTSLGGANTYAHCAFSVTRQLSAADWIELIAYQSTGYTFTTRTVNVVRPFLSLMEVPSW